MNCIKICDKKWVEVNDLSSGQYSVNKNIRFSTSMLGSNLCGYNDAFCCKRDNRWYHHLLADDTNENDKAQKTVAFKINAPFTSCISKINNTLIENEEVIDIVKVSLAGSLWNFYRDEIDDVNDKIVEQSPERPQSFS